MTPTDPVIPYSLPTARPYNAPIPVITPTPDGAGRGTHPSVVDMGEAGWHGHRFWMAFTPYSNSNVDIENPCILVSENGFDWSVPTDQVNPVEGKPLNSYNSDTELVYDATGDRMVLFWRTVENFTTEKIKVSTSTTGTSWTAPAVIATGTGSDILSPAVVRVSATDWRMFAIDSGVGMRRLTATSPTGTWTDHGVTAFVGLATNEAWHVGVLRAGAVFYGLVVDINDPFDIHPIRSADGITWTAEPPIMTRRSPTAWDWKLYRPTLTIKDANWFRVWYGADSNPSGEWRIGYTQMPRSAWNA